MRIRVLPLPEERAGDRIAAPYGIILDRIGEGSLHEELVSADFKEQCGARFVLAFLDDVEVS